MTFHDDPHFALLLFITKFGLTLCDGARSAGFREAVALAHWTTEADVHKSLGGGGQGGSSRQHHPHPSPQQFLHFPEQQAAKDSLIVKQRSR